MCMLVNLQIADMYTQKRKSKEKELYQNSKANDNPLELSI